LQRKRVDKIYIIAGVDAGIKTGYALLDLSGNLLCSGVEKEANDERIVKIISSVGIPSVVASDTSPPSSFVQKVAARFQTKLFHPKKSLTQDEKRIIGKNIDDPHIRDAYAAAIKAYRRYADRLRQIDKMEEVNKDELKHLIIKGEPIGKLLKGK
jgi:predicted RNase H-like nuclease (RuvC/YqgF family)